MTKQALRGNRYAAVAARIVSMVDRDRWGETDPSVYETARVATFAPRLAGWERRLDYLLRSQREDGTWGEGPWSYRLISTLSCVDALLARLISDPAQRQLTAPVVRGLAALRACPQSVSNPDTAAAEIIVPGLVEHVNRLLAESASAEYGGPISLPRGYDSTILARIRQLTAPPEKLNHTFEAIAECFPAPRISAGLLGGSPAATAACNPEAVELAAVGARYSMLFPEAAPISTFERLWVLVALIRAGLPAVVRPIALRWINDVDVSRAVSGVPGLPVDSDDTGVALHVSAELGIAIDPAILQDFETCTHFACYVGEHTGSVTANAHVLHALMSYLARQPDQVGTYVNAVEKARGWLLDQQSSEGYWTDKWHASPYYATAHCVAALAAHDGATAARDADALARAASWVAGTQRADGSWGHWTATAEETAYAAQILLSAGWGDQAPLVRALTALDPIDTDHRHPALWHDKTLYAPAAVIRAEILSTKTLIASALHSRRGATDFVR